MASGLIPAETKKSTRTDLNFVWPDLKSSYISQGEGKKKGKKKERLKIFHLRHLKLGLFYIVVAVVVVLMTIIIISLHQLCAHDVFLPIAQLL